MRNIALGLLLVILLSIFIEPLVEFLNVYRERIVLGSALSNAARAAKNRSLVYESQRQLDAKVDEDRFVDLFSESFEDAMQLTRKKRDGHILSFTSIDGKYNDFTVTLDFEETTDYSSERTISKVTIRAESEYKFKTKYLKIADAAGKDVGYKLIEERKLLLSVKN
ncbi:hypothetical protein [Paenibacillus marinisediminis]